MECSSPVEFRLATDGQTDTADSLTLLSLLCIYLYTKQQAAEHLPGAVSRTVFNSRKRIVVSNK